METRDAVGEDAAACVAIVAGLPEYGTPDTHEKVRHEIADVISPRHGPDWAARRIEARLRELVARPLALERPRHHRPPSPHVRP